jgi:hypothetical protein
MALMHAFSTLRTSCSLRNCVAAATLPGQLFRSAPQHLDVLLPNAQQSCRLQLHAFSTAEQLSDVSGIKRENGQIASYDLLPRYATIDVTVGGPTYSTPERHRREGEGSVCGRRALIKTVSLADAPEAADHALAEVTTCWKLCRGVQLVLRCLDNRAQAIEQSFNMSAESQCKTINMCLRRSKRTHAWHIYRGAILLCVRALEWWPMTRSLWLSGTRYSFLVSASLISQCHAHQCHLLTARMLTTSRSGGFLW